mgnify:CR=1 FL=1
MNENKSNFEIISDVIRNRRAIFPVQYSDEPIEQDVVDQIVELANWAPTHRRTEPWRFVIISGDARERLGDFLANTYKRETSVESFNPMKQKKINKKCLQSQYIVLICMQRDPQERVPEWEEIAAVSMAVQNMWLACSSLGIGSYWSSPSLINFMDEFVPMNMDERCLGLFYMGNVAGDWPAGRRESMATKVRYLPA